MIAALITMLLAASTFDRTGPVPGWWLGSTQRGAYEVALDRQVFHTGTASATIRCLQKQCDGFGTLQQRVRADRYLGRRIRLSAWVRASNAGVPRLWLRVDGRGSELLAFDNMDDRAKSGTFEWRRQEIVLDVDPGAALICFGVILQRSGQVWVDDVVLEEVERTVKTTVRARGPAPGFPYDVSAAYAASQPEPANLDFEQATAPEVEEDDPSVPLPLPKPSAKPPR